MSLLIKNGRIITATADHKADIFIENETITIIGGCLEMESDQIVDARDKYIFPGGIDPHTHLDMPLGDIVSADDFETGTRAAAHGGTTTLIDFAVQTRGGSPLEALDTWHKKAEGKAAIDYGFHMIVTDVDDGHLRDLSTLVQEGVTSFKLFTAYPGRLYVDDAILYRVMRQANKDGALTCIHAENGIVIDEIVRSALAEGKTTPKWHALTRSTRLEAEAVHRVTAIAEEAQAPVYLVHISSADALEQLVAARDRGIQAFAETCPQYLFLDQTYYDQKGLEGAKYVMTPPLREKWNQAKLWHGLQKGDIQVTATDHCPFRFADQKTLGIDNFTQIPSGCPGVENRMALIFHGGVIEGRIGLQKFVEVTSTAAAKLFGLYPRKGTIDIGSDADLVIFDPNRKETISVHNSPTHHMRVDYSAYEGMTVQGFPETVVSRGRIIIRDGEYKGKKGNGQYLRRSGYAF